MSLMPMMSGLILMLMQTSVLVCGCYEDEKRRVRFLIRDITFPCLSQHRGRVLCVWKWVGCSRCFYPTHSLRCPSGRGSSCAVCSGLQLQDALWIFSQPSLWSFRQDAYSVLLLFWALIFPRSLTLGDGSDGKWFWDACSPAAALGVVEAS